MAVPKTLGLKYLFVLSLVLPMIGGCVKSRSVNLPIQPVPCGAESSSEEAYSRLEAKLHDIEKQLAVCRDENETRRIENQRMRIAMLEKEARNRQLGAHLSFQKQMADEAVIEVVRAKAKLRSIESRAEAASTMAETEIAIKGIKQLATMGTIGSSEHLIKADALLKMSTEEFKRENYGGALYLAGQAKIQVKALKAGLEQDRLHDQISGEVLFLPPLPLKLIKRSNLRDEPDINSTIRRTLEKGELIVGYSHKDEWIRVNTESGDSGWIHQSLVDAR